MPAEPPSFTGHPHQAEGFDARGPQPEAGQKKSLFAPWRVAYIARNTTEKDNTGSDGCFLCRLAASPAEDAKNLVVRRGKLVFMCLNLFPYSNGHLLVAPYRHIPDLADLNESETLELFKMAQEGCRRLKAAMDPKGFNLGLNLGACAGAGVLGHIHLHVVPRWPGDTNFMPIIGDVRVIPQALEETYQALVGS